MNRKQYDTVVANNIRRLRARKRVSQETLALILGISPSAYSNRESSKYSFDSWEVYAIAQHLEVPLWMVIPAKLTMEQD